MRVKLRLLGIWLIACLVAGSILGALYVREAAHTERAIRESEANRVALFAQMFGQDFRG